MKFALSLLALFVFATASYAGPFRRRAVLRNRTTTYTLNTPLGPVSKTSSHTTIRGNVSAVTDAITEVNAARAARGLPPFIHDPVLSQAAQSCADTRARFGIAGHTANDFAALSPGSSARAAGCAAWEPGLGWGSCCTYEAYTYAGAAVAIGNDGRRYMHLFVR
jgi:hypothetical protein